MRYLIILVFLVFYACDSAQNKVQEPVKREKWAIAIHGGAGNIRPEDFKEGEVELYEKELKAALEIGKRVLSEGGSSLDAVERVVRYLEDCPLFNAGKGAVFTHDGRNELDAAIMDGRDLNAGTIAGVGDIKNPISVARMVMEQSPHVMMVGKGASKFAKEHGAEIVDSSYFYTERRWKSLQKALEKAGKMGTVGCVALDQNGNLAAATSTGGMTNKMYGRVGDVPIIGAGTYANNKTCALSATGHGEYFIRYTVTHDISALMEYKGMSLQKAAEKVINDKLEKVDGRGGVIGVDKNGNIALVMNTTGMFRAFAKASGEEGVSVFR
ncbi:MAG: isoaspartyl peptidase/L-asparaginase [Chlorobi bacterium]|nr:isoaspartyl peptidase/L-asparaginase [Chlorobiota bacterium]